MDLILNLPDFDDSNQGLGESYYTFFVNYGPYKGLVVDVTMIDNKRAVIFHKRGEFTKIYYPSDIKVSHKNYETDGKYMISILCPDFWVYHEKICEVNSDFTNFGKDMDMIFLTQQNFQDL